MDLKEQYDKLLKYCYMKTKDSFLAEDIVQETFLKFWKNHSYEDTGREMAYLYTIARNLCMDEFRRKRTDNIEDYPEFESTIGENPESVIESISIEYALDRLPDEIREIVVMRYISDMSAADIGKVMKMSRFSIDRRLKEGLRLLKKELQGGKIR